MCTLAIYVRRFPAFPLVVAANRDEFLDRPASAPLLLAEHPRIVGGRDERAGGTWLAVSDRGMVAGLLNRRAGEAPIASKRSRGELPLMALGEASAAMAEHRLRAIVADDYNAFSLLVADRERAWVAHNRDGVLHVVPLEPGLNLLTNLDVNDPTCPKIGRSHHLFAAAGDAFAADGDCPAFRASLRGILADHTTALDRRLPDALGALCVHTDRFGTRCSSLLFLDADGRWEHWFADGPPCEAAYQPAATPDASGR
jgi:uncharacterized protein with NRDE domain